MRGGVASAAAGKPVAAVCGSGCCGEDCCSVGGSGEGCGEGCGEGGTTRMVNGEPSAVVLCSLRAVDGRARPAAAAAAAARVGDAIPDGADAERMAGAVTTSAVFVPAGAGAGDDDAAGGECGARRMDVSPNCGAILRSVRLESLTAAACAHTDGEGGTAGALDAAAGDAGAAAAAGAEVPAAVGLLSAEGTANSSCLLVPGGAAAVGLVTAAVGEADALPSARDNPIGLSASAAVSPGVAGGRPGDAAVVVSAPREGIGESSAVTAAVDMRSRGGDANGDAGNGMALTPLMGDKKSTAACA